MPVGMGDVYLRWFRLHSAGVSLSIPPVAPADVPAIPAQELGHLPAVLQTFTCGAITSAVGVHLSIPPVAPADVPALFHPRIGTSTCGATDIYLRC